MKYSSNAIIEYRTLSKKFESIKLAKQNLNYHPSIRATISQVRSSQNLEWRNISIEINGYR